MDRSPTAESLFKHSKDYEAKSAGIHLYAVRKVNQELINWADIIFVMSEKHDGHLSFLKENFDLKAKKVYDLDIPDVYKKGDLKLVELLKRKIFKYLSEMQLDARPACRPCVARVRQLADGGT